ncbi:MAG: hypothetical protein C0601_04505 [Candidatus Muiribacterium halophilum]|uniref:Uncharacterized protein n=1 Tax=Muiribacterium halophilum TaxID=2053465 RepID=A0A2N5ZIQ6_MUIH1|nr:MAG: hypothetical protein C0601_04505 [Candidatus Muirbacterium halophilum]
MFDDRLAQNIYEIISKAACTRNTITYIDLTERINDINEFSDISSDEIINQMQFIDSMTIEEKGAPISAVVVNSTTKIPGKGFFCNESVKSFIYQNYPGKDIFNKKVYRDIRRKVFQILW